MVKVASLMERKLKVTNRHQYVAVHAQFFMPITYLSEKREARISKKKDKLLSVKSKLFLMLQFYKGSVVYSHFYLYHHLVSREGIDARRHSVCVCVSAEPH